MIWVKELLEKIPRFSKCQLKIEDIEKNFGTNPTVCVELCKTLIEEICKTILIDRQHNVEEDWKFHELVGITVKSFKFEESPYQEGFIKLTQRLSGFADSIGKIRNECNYASHGKNIEHPAIDKDIALFVIQASNAVLGMILHLYLRDNNTGNARISYENLPEFNDYLDERYPSELGISASKALYEQDYEAYKEFYLEFADSLGVISISQ